MPAASPQTPVVEFIIVGTTLDGKAFRPSDWAERLCGVMSAFGGDHRNSIVIAGYQAPGTRGAALLSGAQTLRIFGEEVRINCAVESIEELSAHADYEEICGWLNHFEQAPRSVFITHGEPAAADHLRQVIEQRYGWNVAVPEMGQEFSLP